MITTEIWLYVLLGMGVVLAALLIRRLARVRVWIRTHGKAGQPYYNLGYLEQDDSGEAAEVHVSGGGKRAAIGRVRADGQQNTQKGIVDVLINGLEDDGGKPRYKQMGYIQFSQDAVVDQYGCIYRQVKGNKKREMIGYTARPSDPDTPTIYGERSWKTLWLECQLNAYAGKPAKKDNSEEGKAKGKKKKGKKKEPMAICKYSGLHNSKRDYLPLEARACAYAMLYHKTAKQDFREYYKDQPYGWKDTALLTSFVYSLLFLLLYIVNTGIFQMPLLGHDERAVGILIGFYYVLWAVIRMIKTEAIENSNSFQPKLDLFNKNLGHKWSNWLILILSLPAMAFTVIYYDYDLLPLIYAISFGVAVNMSLKPANRRWKVSATFNEEEETEEEGEEEDEVKNPDGDITRTYDWDLDATYSIRRVHGNVTLYFSANEIADLRHCNPFFSQRKEKPDKEYILDMFHFLKEHRQMLARVRYIAAQINKISEKNEFTTLDKIQFTLDFVQEPNIQFIRNKESKVINYYEDYIRFPDETLYDQAGDCNSKSLLAAMLFYAMERDVIYLASRKHQHAAIGVEIKEEEKEESWWLALTEDMLIEENGKMFLYCETTGDNFSMGSRIGGMQLDDFEQRVLLPVVEEDVDERGEGTETRIYTWDLSAESGRTLQGNLALEFDTDLMALLREQNPFTTYGTDGKTYEMNVREIFGLIHSDADYMQQVTAVADYIREEAKAAGLSEFDMLQFAVNFAQGPNIEYRLDEDCESINYRKEYMRFPDEVMYDKEGDCDCKSSLTAALFHALGYDVLFLISSKLQHAAIGLEMKEEWLAGLNIPDRSAVVREHNGKNYLFCETTGEGNWLGHINGTDSIMDFETVVELPCEGKMG